MRRRAVPADRRIPVVLYRLPEFGNERSPRGVRTRYYPARSRVGVPLRGHASIGNLSGRVSETPIRPPVLIV